MLALCFPLRSLGRSFRPRGSSPSSEGLGTVMGCASWASGSSIFRYRGWHSLSLRPHMSSLPASIWWWFGSRWMTAALVRSRRSRLECYRHLGSYSACSLVSWPSKSRMTSIRPSLRSPQKPAHSEPLFSLVRPSRQNRGCTSAPSSIVT